MLRIIYMGTPQFAVPALEGLVAASAPGALLPEGLEIVTVVTRPDKAAGRGREVVFSPVKQAALDHGLTVWQPGSFKKSENSNALAAYEADLFIVAAFGQILPQAVLDLPRYGTLNIHASLLPKYRGPDPIAESILQGDSTTGVSIMLLDAGIDTGPVLLRKEIELAENETTARLTSKLAHLGAEALLETIPAWVAGAITPEAQDEERASHTHLLKKEDGLIHWSQPAAAIARAVRAYTPWPSAYTYWQGKLLKIIEAQAAPITIDENLSPGTVKAREEAGHQVVAVTTGSGTLLIQQLQLAGKRAMSAEEFLRGYHQIVDDVLE